MWASSAAAQGMPEPYCPPERIPRPIERDPTASPPAYFGVPLGVDVRIPLEPLERLDLDISNAITGEAISAEGEAFAGIARLDPRQRALDEIVWHPDVPLAPGEYEFVMRVAANELPNCELEAPETTTLPLTVLDATLEEVVDALAFSVSASQRQLPVEPDCCLIADCTAGPCTQCWQVITQVQHIFDWLDVPGAYYLDVTLTPDVAEVDPVSVRGSPPAVIYSPEPDFCVEAWLELAGTDEVVGTLDACSEDTLPDELPPTDELLSVSPESCETWPENVVASARTLWVARGEDEPTALAKLGVVLGGAPGSGGQPASGGETSSSGGTGGRMETGAGCVAGPIPAAPTQTTWGLVLLLATWGARRRGRAAVTRHT